MRYPHIFRRIAGPLLLPAALLIFGGWKGLSPGVAVCCPGFGAAAPDDVRCSDADRGRCIELLDALRPMRAMRSDSLLVEAARLMLGTPYVAGTLEGAPEQLTVALCRSDCILLVEACAALVSTVKGEDCSFEAFVGNLRSMRYRNGVVDGYPSRLHYTSEWALQAGRLGILEEVTASLGGIPLKQDFSFMSTHPGSYPALKNDPGAVSAIREAERALARNTYYYIPKSKLSPLQSRIRHGDIICFTSSVTGLDIAHLGIAVRENGKLKFIHASSVAGKVVVEPSAPAGYLASKKGMSGLRVLRMI